MPVVIDWPGVLVPARILIAPPVRTLSASGSISGSEQFMPARRAPFRMMLDFPTLMGPQVLAWRAVCAALDGQAGLVRVPMFDLYEASAALSSAGVPFGDGAPFADTSLFGAPDVEGVTASCAAGARSVVVDFGAFGQILQAGQYFGLGDDPHIATAISWAGPVATIQFRSSAKRAHVDAPLTLRPTLIGRMADDEQGGIVLDYGAHGQPSLALVEAIGWDTAGV